MYNLDDLKQAKEELELWKERSGNDRSNNPNKYEAQIRDAGIKVRAVEKYLKDQEIIPKTDNEILNEKLDKMYPNAESNSVHTMDGKKYKIKYFPQVQSRSRKTVKEWDHSWSEVE